MTVRRRIVVQYGGAEFAIADRPLDAVVAEIDRGLAAGGAWLPVHAGEGRSTPARIRIAAGIPIGVWEINADGGPTPVEPSDEV